MDTLKLAISIFYSESNERIIMNKQLYFNIFNISENDNTPSWYSQYMFHQVLMVTVTDRLKYIISLYLYLLKEPD